MRIERATAVLLTCAIAAPLAGQEVQAGAGYARVFRAGGFSFGAAVQHPLTTSRASLRHSVGGSLWYATTGIGSNPTGSGGRELVGLGVRYEMTVARCCGRLQPVVAVPLMVLHSSVADVTGLEARPGELLGVPQPTAPVPAEDLVGSEWGWGAGLELGLRLSAGDRWSPETRATGVYQDIYATSASHGAWTWLAGLSYRFGGP